MSPDEFYQSYIADDTISPLSEELIERVKAFYPKQVLDFGCGTGKHIAKLPKNIVTCGLDISLQNIILANAKNDCKFLVLGKQEHLGHFKEFDVVITCSVLDHIVDIDQIITEFKRIAQKSIIIAETNDVPGKFYFPHNYEKYGFVKQDFEWEGADGAKYYIWQWLTNMEEFRQAHDDMAL